MNDTNPTVAAKSTATAAVPRRRLALDLPRPLIIGCLGLIACFAWPLYNWLSFSLKSDLYSYTLLVPFVSVYLFGLNRKDTSPTSVSSYRGLGALLGLIGLVTITCFWFAKLSGMKLVPQDAVALTTLSFVLILAGGSAWGMKPSLFRQAAFPLTFLLFMAPFPVAMEHAIEAFLQRGSAPPAYWLFNLVGTTVFRSDLVFQLPGITLQIAPECSGIRSTLVLFMVSLLAGYLFLRSPWKRAALSVAVIPLALVRNGFRVFTIGQLCVSIGPHMIDSPIHHRGGPIFFALSLIPFFALVYFLVRSDRSSSRTTPVAANSSHG